jgi:hypothetical protein
MRAMPRLALSCLTPLAVAGAILASAGTAAARIEHPWCAMIPVFQGSRMADCQYDTLEQCLPEIRGMGGSCDPNPYFRPPQAREYHRLPRRKVRRPPSG